MGNYLVVASISPNNAMRKMSFGEIDISMIKLNPKSRDDIPAILVFVSINNGNWELWHALKKHKQVKPLLLKAS